MKKTTKKEQLKRFGEDLLNLEINTIVKDNITGRKMYGARLALIQIAKKFNIKLRQLGCSRPKEDEMKSDKPESFEEYKDRVGNKKANESLLGSLESFKDINDRARTKISSYQGFDKQEGNADLWMLYRIKGASKTISNLFENLKPNLLKELKGNAKFWDETRHEENIRRLLPFPPEQLRIIRKAWELGVEEIAMQTVIQLDGDVVTRVLPKYAKEEYNTLHNLHNQGITTSIKFWKTLVDIVKDVVHFIISFIK